MNRVGVIGHRSWIAGELITELRKEPERYTWVLPKTDVDAVDLTGFDCIYAVLGRARPTSEEGAAEVSQLAALLRNGKPPRRIVYISSLDQTPVKRTCEALCRTYTGTANVVVIRPPAVFGPGQPITSPMLIPSLAREGGSLELMTPDWPTKFISARHLAQHLVKFADPMWWDHLSCAQPITDSTFSLFEIPGTLTATPAQLRELWRTWSSYVTSGGRGTGV